MAKTTKLLGTDISDTHIIWAIAIVFILYLLWRGHCIFIIIQYIVGYKRLAKELEVIYKVHLVI